MEYTTYEFYQNKYFGNAIADADFAKYELKARMKLNYLTENRITEEDFADDNMGYLIQMSVCAIAEELQKIDKAADMTGTSETGEGKIIKSKSSGSESISYDTGSDIHTRLVGNTGEINRTYLMCAKEYLSGTGLLYRGCQNVC